MKERERECNEADGYACLISVKTTISRAVSQRKHLQSHASVRSFLFFFLANHLVDHVRAAAMLFFFFFFFLMFTLFLLLALYFAQQQQQ